MTDSVVVERRPEAVFGAAVLAGGLVAVLAGVYGNTHDPASETTVQFFFSTTLHMKAWMTTLAAVLAITQLVSALWIWGQLPFGDAPPWLGSIHRLLGTLTLAATIPVAYHCLWALGFETDIGETRRFWHSVFGCAFYGTYVTKVISVRSHRMPGWALPVVGGTLFTGLILIWLTSSLWFFDNIGIEF